MKICSHTDDHVSIKRTVTDTHPCRRVVCICHIHSPEHNQWGELSSSHQLSLLLLFSLYFFAFCQHHPLPVTVNGVNKHKGDSLSSWLTSESQTFPEEMGPSLLRLLYSTDAAFSTPTIVGFKYRLEDLNGSLKEQHDLTAALAFLHVFAQ